MKKLRISAIVLLIISIPLLSKAYSLYNRVPDGDGIGVSFLGFEINDRVLTEQIPQYATTFLIVGVIILLVSFIMFYRSRKEK